jgi:nucleotide-binding universal stress UspA family protein
MEKVNNECERHILVPIDFTPESVHALRYARMIASHLQMGITIIHVHEPLFDPVTGSALDTDIMKNNKERLQHIMIEVGWDQYRTENQVPVTTHFDIGDIATHVLHLVEDAKYSCIIMSGHPESSFVKRLFGSVSTHVGRESLKPVIVVPQQSPLKAPKRFVAGLSDELLREDALQFLLEFAGGADACFEFIHVSNDDGEFQELKANLTDKLKALNKNENQYHIRSIPASAVGTESVLIDFMNTFQADMLVLATHQRNFIETLGHRSITRKILSHPVLPVMILHGQPDKGLGITDYLYNAIKEG